LGPKGMTDLGHKAGRLIRKIARSTIWQDIVSTSRDINELPGKIMGEVDLEEEMKEIREASTLTRQLDTAPPNPENKTKPK
ncbi:MAG: hypothetical protein JW704_05290, partial [Anaerolineaceae bacterium]|nr:hypothetical protein [Anaerolineaceae bacterium]